VWKDFARLVLSGDDTTKLLVLFDRPLDGFRSLIGSKVAGTGPVRFAFGGIPASWKNLSWRRRAKGRLTAHFAALRIRIADG